MNSPRSLWNSARSSVTKVEDQIRSGVSDNELVRLFCETGDAECFAELYTRHRQKVFYACLRFFPQRSEAEDAAQETFLRAFQNLHRYREGDFEAWLMRIARNVCIDQWRKRRPEAGIEDTELAESRTSRLVDSPTDQDLIADLVYREMATLSPEQQRCLKLKIEGYSYEETAARTGLSIDAVKSHLQNGRRMLWLKLKGLLTQLK